jgi:hypothetical protein
MCCVVLVLHYEGKCEGVGPWKSRLFWASNHTRLSARWHFTGPKKVSISRDHPPPTCPRNGCCPHQKHYTRGCINHRCINSEYFFSTMTWYDLPLSTPPPLLNKCPKREVDGGWGRGRRLLHAAT